MRSKIHSPYNLSPLLGALQFRRRRRPRHAARQAPGGEYRAAGVGVRLSRQGHAAHPTAVAQYFRCRAPCSGGHHARQRWIAHSGSCSGLPHHSPGDARSLTSNKHPSSRWHLFRNLPGIVYAAAQFLAATVRTKPWHVSAPLKQAEAEQRAAERARKEAELNKKAAPWMARARAEGCFLGANFSNVRMPAPYQ